MLTSCQYVEKVLMPDLQAGFFTAFTFSRGGRVFERVNETSRDTPETCAGFHDATHEENSTGIDHHYTRCHLGVFIMHPTTIWAGGT